MIVRIEPAQLIDRVEDCRSDRINLIRENRQPTPLPHGPRIVLHIVPSNAFTAGVNFERVNMEFSGLEPFGGGGRQKFNFDGFASIDTTAYVQIFHNGVIESVNTSFFDEYDGSSYIPLDAWEEELIKCCSRYIELDVKLGATLPMFIAVSVLGVATFQFLTRQNYRRRRGMVSDRDEFLLPPLEVCNAYSLDRSLRPIFNRLWNCAGYSHSLNYNENRERKGR